MWSVFWWRIWRSAEDSSEVRHNMVVSIGFLLLLGAAFAYHLGTGREDWPAAQAEVLTVSVRCEMQSSRAVGRSDRPVVIGCDQVSKFRADNAGRHWTESRRYSGDVRVTRDGKAVSVAMGLGRVGNPPRVGDKFMLVQDPDDPASVSFPDQSLSEKMVAASLGGLGVFVLAIAFFWI